MNVVEQKKNKQLYIASDSKGTDEQRSHYSTVVIIYSNSF